MPLGCVYQVYDGASRFCHVIACIRIIIKHLPFDLLLMPTMLSRVARRTPSDPVNLNHYNSLGGHSRFTPFHQMNSCPIRVHRLPLHLSENRGLRLES